MAGLEDCLRLLRGESDEQRLAGLLLVTKFCNKDDHASIRKVYQAVGTRFLHRLLRTGMGTGNAASGGNENREAYLHLSVSVLAAFCRVPEIAASEDMVANIPSVLQVMEKGSASVLLEDCYEFLFLTASASESGVTTLFECGGLRLLATHLPSFPDGSQLLDLSLRLVMLILSKITLDAVVNEYLMELSNLVASVGRQAVCFVAECYEVRPASAILCRSLIGSFGMHELAIDYEKYAFFLLSSAHNIDGFWYGAVMSIPILLRKYTCARLKLC